MTRSLVKEIGVELWKIKRCKSTEKHRFDEKEVPLEFMKVEVLDLKTGAIVNKHYGLPPGASQRRM